MRDEDIQTTDCRKVLKTGGKEQVLRLCLWQKKTTGQWGRKK